MTVLELLENTTRYFAKHAVSSPRLTIELMLAEILQKTRMQLYLEFDQPVSDPVMDRLIEEGRREPDRAKRAVIYKELQARFVAELPNLIDNMPYYRNVMNKRILGFDSAKAGSQFSSMMFYQPEWWIAQ